MLAPLQSQGQSNQQGVKDDCVWKVQGEVDIFGRLGSVASVHHEGLVQIGRCEPADCFRKWKREYYFVKTIWWGEWQYKAFKGKGSPELWRWHRRVYILSYIMLIPRPNFIFLQRIQGRREQTKLWKQFLWPCADQFPSDKINRGGDFFLIGLTLIRLLSIPGKSNEPATTIWAKGDSFILLPFLLKVEYCSTLTCPCVS